MEDLVIEEEGASSALKITLGDFLVFINWMNQTEESLDHANALPAMPDIESGKVRGWIQLVHPSDDPEIDELLKHADAAMYRAKQQGGSCFRFHTADAAHQPLSS